MDKYIRESPGFFVISNFNGLQNETQSKYSTYKMKAIYPLLK